MLFNNLSYFSLMLFLLAINQERNREPLMIVQLAIYASLVEAPVAPMLLFGCSRWALL